MNLGPECLEPERQASHLEFMGNAPKGLQQNYGSIKWQGNLAANY